MRKNDQETKMEIPINYKLKTIGKNTIGKEYTLRALHPKIDSSIYKY